MSVGGGVCWVVVGAPTGDDYPDPCYPDAANAELWAAELRREGHRGAAVRKRDTECLSADCDGCYLPLEGDNGIVHEADRAALDASLALMEWMVTDDGRVLCETCKVDPHRGGVPADPPHLPIPGDTPLFDLGVSS